MRDGPVLPHLPVRTFHHGQLGWFVVLAAPILAKFLGVSEVRQYHVPQDQRATGMEGTSFSWGFFLVLYATKAQTIRQRQTKRNQPLFTYQCHVRFQLLFF